jgi:Flp pilus assembly protein TadD
VSCLQAADERQTPEAPSVFDLPALQREHATSLRLIAELLGRQNYEQAEKALRKAIERVPHDPNSYYNLACAYAMLGEKDKALDALGKAVAAGFTDRRWMGQDSNLDGLRGDPRFKAIAKRIGSSRDD